MKYIHLLFEFKQTEFFTSHGGYLLIIIIIIMIIIIIIIIIMIILLLITRKFAYVYVQCPLQK